MLCLSQTRLEHTASPSDTQDLQPGASKEIELNDNLTVAFSIFHGEALSFVRSEHKERSGVNSKLSKVARLSQRNESKKLKPEIQADFTGFVKPSHLFSDLLESEFTAVSVSKKLFQNESGRLKARIYVTLRWTNINPDKSGPILSGIEDGVWQMVWRLFRKNIFEAGRVTRFLDQEGNEEFTMLSLIDWPEFGTRNRLVSCRLPHKRLLRIQ